MQHGRCLWTVKDLVVFHQFNNHCCESVVEDVGMVANDLFRNCRYPERSIVPSRRPGRQLEACSSRVKADRIPLADAGRLRVVNLVAEQIRDVARGMREERLLRRRQRHALIM